MTEPNELRKLALPELEDKARGLRRQLFVLRSQKGQGQLAKPSQLRIARRELARLLTLVGERKREGGKS